MVNNETPSPGEGDTPAPDTAWVMEVAAELTRYAAAVYALEGEATPEDTAFSQRVAAEHTEKLNSMSRAEVNGVVMLTASFTAAAVAELARIYELEAVDVVDAVINDVTSQLTDDDD